MNREADDGLALALDLPAEERAEVAGVLLESLESSPDPEVEAAWREQVARRVSAIDAGEVELVPWEDVRDKLLRRIDERRSN